MNQQNKSTPSVWQSIFPTLKILIALLLAVIVGSFLDSSNSGNKSLIEFLALPSNLIFRAMQALAVPVVFIAFIYKLDASKIRGRYLPLMLLTNTIVAALIGTLVFYLLYPNAWDYSPATTILKQAWYQPWLELIKGLVPSSIIEPLEKNHITQIIVITLSLGAAFRAISNEEIAQKNIQRAIRNEEIAQETIQLSGREVEVNYQILGKVLEVINDAMIQILRWVTALLPLAVFGFVLKSIAEDSFKNFASLGIYVLVVIVALLFQVCYYLARLKFNSSVKPRDFLVKGQEGFLTAFGTASGFASRNFTFKALQKIGLKNTSARLGAFVLQPINKDGTALYQTMYVLFISVIQGYHLNWAQLFVVILTSVFVSVSTAGIPNSGLVSMTLVFSSIGLDMQYIALLSTVYWLIDNCTTAINVMGNMTVATLVDKKNAIL